MEGDPHATAVALEWALLEICRRDKRDLYCLPFSGVGQFHVWQAPQPGQPDPQGLVDHLAQFYNAGTEPYQPLTKALELIADGDLRADVLIITDGATLGVCFKSIYTVLPAGDVFLTYRTGASIASHTKPIRG